MEHELPLEELENTLDLISFKLNNLQYASDVTNYYPSILNFYEQNITIFQREIPLSITATLCRALDLPILTLDNVPYFNDSSYNILFDTEIIVKPREILCTGPSLYLKNDFCIAYLINLTATKRFYKFEEKDELKKVFRINLPRELYTCKRKCYRFIFLSIPKWNYRLLRQLYTIRRRHLSTYSQYFS